MKAVGFNNSTTELNIFADVESWRFSPLLKHLPEQISPPKIVPSMEADITMMGSQFHINMLPEGVEVTPSKAFANIYDKDSMALIPSELTKTLALSVTKSLTRPLKIKVIRTGDKQSGTIASLQMNISRNVSCIILQENHGLEEGLTIEKMQFNLEAGSTLDHAVIIREGEQALHVGTYEYTLEADSKLHQTVLAQGGKMTRIQLGLKLVGENANAHVASLNALDGKAHVDFHSLIRHESPRTYSSQKAKNFLNGESKGIFTGRIYIAPQAQQVEAQQMNRNLLLSKKAHAFGQPQLEINADDVKCAHGSSTGQIEEEATFYLESRGIAPKRAQEMLALGFVHEVFGNTKNSVLKKALETAFHGRA